MFDSKENSEVENEKKKERKLPDKPEWQIILEHLVYQDQTTVYRICRKMIIYLNRKKVPEVKKIMSDLSPETEDKQNIQRYGPNWPKPRGRAFNPSDIIQELFTIADENLDDDEITSLLSEWIHQEQIGFLSLMLERRHVPLAEVKEAVKKYLNLSFTTGLQSIEERIGIRVALISRFLSENLTYINIAKNYVTIIAIDQVLNRTIGPATGYGKLGGKSAGLILARQILLDRRVDNPMLHNVRTPKSRFMTSDSLYDFLHYNALEEFVYTKYQSSGDIQEEHSFLEYIFKNSHFSSELTNALNMILDEMNGRPLIVRSSSLLEDSFEGAFSGKYKSLFLANIGTKDERLQALMDAIAEVYASTFGADPIEYRRERKLLDFREEMGILIQEVVGTRIGKYYLPSYSGVAFSKNEFRWSSRIKRSDGVVRLVAGLGTRAVDRTIDDYPTLVSPGQPNLKVNQSHEDQVRYAQKSVDVINMDTQQFESVPFSEIIKESKGYFKGLEKIVSFDRGNTLVDPVSAMANFEKEDMVITFHPLIQKTDFIKQMQAIMNELETAFRGPVDVEFASDGEKIYLLQCRPQSQFSKDIAIKLPVNIEEKDKLFTANEFVNTGAVEDIRYVVYVNGDEYNSLQDADSMRKTGKIINYLNSMLPKKRFILIGPGRWGSKGDIKLGVPVVYSDINNTAMLIEVAWDKHGYVPELSFGTHFFQDLVEADIKYLALYPDKPGNLFNRELLLRSPNSLKDFAPEFKDFEKVVRLIDIKEIEKDAMFSVYMDGDKGEALGFVNRSAK